MPIESVRCLTRLVMRCLQDPPARDFTLSQHYFASSMLPYARTWVFESAARAGATHFLALDSDMTYPENTGHRLLAGVHLTGSGFVAANCPTRRPPIRWTARGEDGQTHESRGAGATWSPVRTVGVAVAIITAELWAKLERPAFNFAATPKGWIGEDIWFCGRVAQAGAVPMVDNELSLEVGHVGAREHTAADIEPGGET